jgi:hypothetical protein
MEGEMVQEKRREKGEESEQGWVQHRCVVAN